MTLGTSEVIYLVLILFMWFLGLELHKTVQKLNVVIMLLLTTVTFVFILYLHGKQSGYELVSEGVLILILGLEMLLLFLVYLGAIFRTESVDIGR